MKSYKPGSATYKDNIPIVETTDTNHADNVNQAPKQLIAVSYTHLTLPTKA